MLGLPFHHIGIACSDIDATADFVIGAFAVVSDTGKVHDPLQDVDVRLFNEGLPGAIELVAGPKIQELLSRQMSYYHVCYVTPNIEETIKAARAIGALQAGPIVPAALFGGRKIVFMYTALGLIEFLESESPAPGS